jgi:SAM-dependent methyltransferase
MADLVEAPGPDLSAWFTTPPGQYLLGWEQACFDEAVVDLFGYNALQLGLPELQTLAANRMPHRWLAAPEAAVWAAPPDLVTHAAALPFHAQTLDLVTLPHTLELSADPHEVLREVERVLVPEGRVVVSGLNPTSLWGWRQQRAHWCRRVGWQTGPGQLFLPEAGDFIGHWRLRDWLRLLGFEVEVLRLGCYRPAVDSDKWLQRFEWMDRVGPRWWPVLGAVYFVVAVKRVRGMRLLGPAWKPRRAAAAPVAVVQRPSVGAMTGDPSA